jgi:hypothetical protein
MNIFLMWNSCIWLFNYFFLKKKNLNIACAKVTSKIKKEEKRKYKVASLNTHPICNTKFVLSWSPSISTLLTIFLLGYMLPILKWYLMKQARRQHFLRHPILSISFLMKTIIITIHVHSINICSYFSCSFFS